MAGDLSLWMGAGRDLIQESWTNITLGVQLCGILSDLSWGGWQSLEFPHVVKRLPDLLEFDAIGGLRLLATLHNAERVKGVPAAWLLHLEEWILKRIEGWVLTPEKVRHYL
jgi:U3 small nucleolar RNA-associated protein 20